jgi:hypothetical protein
LGLSIPTFDFLTIIQTEIKKSKNRRIEESQIEVEVVTTDRHWSEFIYFSATVSRQTIATDRS